MKKKIIIFICTLLIFVATSCAEKSTDPGGSTTTSSSSYIASAEELALIEKVKAAVAAGGYDVNATESEYNNNAILVYGASLGYQDLVTYLLTLDGIQIDAISTTAFTAYSYSALMYASVNGHAGTVEILIKAGATIDLEKSSDNSTALSFAARYGHLDVVRLLVEANADINHINSSNYTPVHLALLNGHTEVEAYLRANGGLTYSELNP